MKEKHRKSLGFGIHTHTHTHRRRVLFSVHRCWYALHSQIVCKSVQKVTVRVWVREDPDALGATSTGQADLTNSKRQMLRDTKEGRGEGRGGLRTPTRFLAWCWESAHMRPRQLRSVGPPQSALAPTPPTPTLPDICVSLCCEWRYLCRAADVGGPAGPPSENIIVLWRSALLRTGRDYGLVWIWA